MPVGARGEPLEGLGDSRERRLDRTVRVVERYRGERSTSARVTVAALLR